MHFELSRMSRLKLIAWLVDWIALTEDNVSRLRCSSFVHTHALYLVLDIYAYIIAYCLAHVHVFIIIYISYEHGFNLFKKPKSCHADIVTKVAWQFKSRYKSSSLFVYFAFQQEEIEEQSSRHAQEALPHHARLVGKGVGVGVGVGAEEKKPTETESLEQKAEEKVAKEVESLEATLPPAASEVA